MYATKSYRTIREHRKSRLGCFTCKRRRVKCDECRPVCRACRLRDTPCEYGDQTISTQKPSAGKADTRVAVTSIHEPIACLPSTDASDMRMLWFFTANTSTSFLQEPRGQGTFGSTMQTAVVEKALSHPFLMKTLFALAGLHMQHLRQDIDGNAVIRYRAEAVQSYRSAVQVADPATFEALLVNAMLVEVLPCGEFRDPAGKPLYILDWMALWRGIGCILDLMDKKPEGDIKTLLDRPSVDKTSGSAVPRSLQRMVDDIKVDDGDYRYLPAYREALTCLGALYDNLRDGIDTTMTMRTLTWFTLLPDEFVRLARKKVSRALVVLGHYAAFLALFENIWWMDGIGRRSVRDVCHHLGAQWKHVMMVPRRVAEAETQSDMVYVLLANDT